MNGLLSAATRRQKSLALLLDLDEINWQKKGRHAFFGPTSLQELVNLTVQHDQVHLHQIEELLIKNE